MVVHLSRNEEGDVPRCSVEFDQTFNFGHLFHVLFLIQIGTQKTAKLKEGIVALIGKFSDKLRLGWPCEKFRFSPW